MPWLEVAVGAVMLLGLVGTVVPVWPGLVVVWAAGLAYGLIAGFGTLGTAAFVGMTALAAIGTVAKVALPARTGAGRGADARTGLAAAGGALLGALVVPVLGLPVGAFLGVLFGELDRLDGDWSAAWSTTVATVLGYALGAAVELALGTVMLGGWLAWAVWG